MSLLDDFEVLEERGDKACKDGMMNLFLFRFITPYINKTMPKNQIFIHYFDVSLTDVMKYLQGICGRSDDFWCYDVYSAEVSWDLSEWLDKGHNNVYIGYDYLYLPAENKRRLRFKLFNADEIIPDRNIKIDNTRCFHADITQAYINERYKNTYKGYKILSIKTSDRFTKMGWLAFNMDLIIQLASTGWQYPDCDRIPSTYKVIPYGGIKNSLKMMNL